MFVKPFRLGFSHQPSASMFDHLRRRLNINCVSREVEAEVLLLQVRCSRLVLPYQKTFDQFNTAGKTKFETDREKKMRNTKLDQRVFMLEPGK